MRKLFFALLVIGGIVGLGYVALQAIKMNTKKYSPEEVAQYPKKGDPAIKVNYCQPSKKGREIFGEDGLVPNDIVWRTGANEATVIEFAQDVNIGGSTLKAGKYSLFTIPNQERWTVIFNSETGQWGTQYSPDADVLRVSAGVSEMEKVVELFTISLEKVAANTVDLVLMWDQTRVSLPITLDPEK